MSKVTAKFQITIPPEVRSALNIMPGVEVGFQKEKDKFFLIKNPNSDPIEKWRGALKEKRNVEELMAQLRGYGFENIY